jgi:hypothetical protein
MRSTGNEDLSGVYILQIRCEKNAIRFCQHKRDRESMDNDTYAEPSKKNENMRTNKRHGAGQQLELCDRFNRYKALRQTHKIMKS